MKNTISLVLVLALGLAMEVANAATINQAPIADAGLPRYAAQDPVVLDGTGSYDPDSSGPLSYRWQQIAGPSVIISDADTAKPTISGFVQTDAIQECEFELVVSDGELTSVPDTVKVIIVPDFSDSYRLPKLKNDLFDPNKPTFIFFGGSDCITGLPGYARNFFDRDGWLPRVNAIEFPNGYAPDPGPGFSPTYYRCGDMIIVYLSALAPNYNQPIHISGHSGGGKPAVDVGIHLNLTYADPRYAVNRVTFFDVACLHLHDFGSLVAQFQATSVDGEQCWVDNYPSIWLQFPPNALNVAFPGYSHGIGREWYNYSLTTEDMNKFNNGVVAGAYWSVVGPGKNLQLASTLEVETYRFRWYGGETSGHMDFYDESQYPGRLPEPVTLVGPEDGAVVDSNGAVLSCEESENAVGYQLLFGVDTYHLVYLFSDTPSPPSEIVNTFPFEETWWTIKARDKYGSTIYADPICINAESVETQKIENLITGRIYGSIQHAINDAHPADEIVVSSGICQYLENINFKGKNLTLRSTDPNDPAIVAATVINGGDQGTVVTLSGTEETDCVLAGLTILGGTVGASCRAWSVTIRNCTIESNGPNAIEFWGGYEPPEIIDCTILGEVVEKNVLALVTYWALDEEEGTVAYDGVGTCDGRLLGDPVWQPDGGVVAGALQFDSIDDCILTSSLPDSIEGPFSVFAWVKGGAPGQVVISQRGGVNWLCADTSEGNLMTELMGAGRVVAILPSQTVITDGNWHRIGLVWDGSHRTLYVDGLTVAQDTRGSLEVSQNGLYIGTGKALKSGTYWSGLIDDVRIYNRAIIP